MANDIAIGDTVYTFDINRRVYPPRKPGTYGDGPIYREHFCPYTIVGEEKRSWVLSWGHNTGGRTWKHSKYRPGLYTATQVDSDVWMHDHRHKVASLVSSCTDADVLKAVAGLLGYAPEAAP